MLTCLGQQRPILRLMSRASSVFHSVAPHSLSALLHEVITVVHTYCMCRPQCVCTHTERLRTCAQQNRDAHLLICVLLQGCTVLPNVWMFDYSNEMCLKNWLCGIRGKLIMNYGWISLVLMKFRRVNVASVTLFTKSRGPWVCLSLILWAWQVFHNLHKSNITV